MDALFYAPPLCPDRGRPGYLKCAARVAIGEGAALVRQEGFDIAHEGWAGAVQMAGSFLPDLGGQLGVDYSGDVWLPDLPDALIEDAEINQCELVREQVEVFADGDGGFEIAGPVVIEALVGFEATESDE